MPLHDTISPFGGFAPFPNSIMVPVMGLQSDVIGFRFGFGYEKGKRTLRAMSNEKFNALDITEISKIYKEHDSTAINYFQNEMGKFIELQNLIIEKTVEIEMAKARRTPSATAEIIGSFYDGVRNLGAQAGTTGFTWQRLASLLFPFLFSNQEHEHPEDTPIPEDPNAGKGSPGDESPHTKDDEPEEEETETLPPGEELPNVPEGDPSTKLPPPPKPPTPKPTSPPPSSRVFFTFIVHEYDSTNRISFLRRRKHSFNYFQWGQAVTAYILTINYLIKSGRHGNKGIATAKFLRTELIHTTIPKIEAFYKKQLTVNAEMIDI